MLFALGTGADEVRGERERPRGPVGESRRDLSICAVQGKLLGIPQIGFTSHSGRAGFASEARPGGRDFVEIREEGRWLSDSSLRVYIDVVSAASIDLELSLSGLKSAIQFAQSHLRTAVDVNI